jgi:3-hydroxyisobutyrate dehydrogenase-like beta-hydroxyacid dehydrogenase
MRKDLAYAVDEAARHQLSLETAATARDVFQEAIDAGWGSSDMSAVLESVKAHRISGKSSSRGA